MHTLGILSHSMIQDSLIAVSCSDSHVRDMWQSWHLNSKMPQDLWQAVIKSEDTFGVTIATPGADRVGKETTMLRRGQSLPSQVLFDQ